MDDVWEPWVPASRNQQVKGGATVLVTERVGLLLHSLHSGEECVEPEWPTGVWLRTPLLICD